MDLETCQAWHVALGSIRRVFGGAYYVTQVEYITHPVIVVPALCVALLTRTPNSHFSSTRMPGVHYKKGIVRAGLV